MDKKLKSGIVTSVYQASRWKFVLIWVDKISIFFLMENFIGKKKKLVESVSNFKFNGQGNKL